MKHLYLNPGRWLLTLCFFTCCLDAAAQKPTSPAPWRISSANTSFITHAPVLLPELLKEQHYDTIRNFLANWRNSDYPSLELIFSAEALLAIETAKFSSYLLPCDCLLFLSDYARELKTLDTRGSKFRYYLRLTPPYSYDATIEARNLILFIRSWARDLLSKPYLDKDELFICRTLAGDIPDPKTAVYADPGSCPRIARTGQVIESYNNAVFTTTRNTLRGTAGILVGWWTPTGNLHQVLGPHPSVGFQLGIRNKFNEYDLTWSLRFGRPALPYTFVRNDTAYRSDYYDGGYIGFEYTRYFVHRKHFDAGITSGFAYDYFSVENGWGNNPDIARLEPFNVGSADWNNGFRIKYFFKRKHYIGLTAKYHLIHYANDGGTNIDGDAYTIDLSYGSH